MFVIEIEADERSVRVRKKDLTQNTMLHFDWRSTLNLTDYTTSAIYTTWHSYSQTIGEQFTTLLPRCKNFELAMLQE